MEPFHSKYKHDNILCFVNRLTNTILLTTDNNLDLKFKLFNLDSLCYNSKINMDIYDLIFNMAVIESYKMEEIEEIK